MAGMKPTTALSAVRVTELLQDASKGHRQCCSGQKCRHCENSEPRSLARSHRIDCSLSSGSGVVVQATVNDRAEHTFVWVDKGDKTLHFSPNEIDCGNWFGWLTE